MKAPTSTPSQPEDAVLLRKLLQAARAKSANVQDEVHPQWLQGLPTLVHAGTSASSEMHAARASLIARFLRLEWTSLATFRRRAHRIALLPRAALLKVLWAVALYADRDRVRLCIGRELRAEIVARVGGRGYASLLARPPSSHGSMHPFASEELDPDTLASTGYSLLCTHDLCQCEATLAWVRLAVSPSPLPNKAGKIYDVDLFADAAIERLTDLLPEYAWLFGLPMDLALSASTTA